MTDKGRQQAAEQTAIDSVQLEIPAELLEIRLALEVPVAAAAGLTVQRILPIKRNGFAREVAPKRHARTSRDENEIAFGEAYGVMPVHREPALTGQHETVAGELHSRTAQGPTAGRLA